MASFKYPSKHNYMNYHKSNEDILYITTRSKFYDIDDKWKNGVIYTTKEGRKIAVGFPSIINKQVECRCKNCMFTFPYIAIEKSNVVVWLKKVILIALIKCIKIVKIELLLLILF